MLFMMRWRYSRTFSQNPGNRIRALSIPQRRATKNPTALVRTYGVSVRRRADPERIGSVAGIAGPPT
jgi:hypothetical protein